VSATPPKYWGVLVAALLILSGCGLNSSYEPPTATRDPQIESTIAALEEAVNAKDLVAVCALYTYPSTRCSDVWRKRLGRLSLPIDLPVAEIVYGCAGDARAEIAKNGGTTPLINSVSVGANGSGQVDDVGFGSRRSSLVIPEFGDCADPGGFAGDEVCDEANHWGAEDHLDVCAPRRQ
jgi:hypothetical protein